MNKKIPFLLSIFPILLSACGGTGNNRQRSSSNTSSSSISSSSIEKPPLDLMIWVPLDYEAPISREANAWANKIKEEENIKVNVFVKSLTNISIIDELANNPRAGADIYYINQIELSRVVDLSLIQEITDSTLKNAVISENDSESIKFASIGNSLMAYPLSMFTDCSLFYKKDIFTNPQDVTNMTSIIRRCKETGKKISIPLEYPGVASMYFFAFGCESTWIKNSNGDFVSYHDTFNSPNGIKACKAIYELISDDSVYDPSFGWYEALSSLNGGACLSLSSDYQYINDILGDNAGCAELPSVTKDGVTGHLRLSKSYTFLGVKPQTDDYKNHYVQSLAYYLSSKEAQMARTEYGFGPTNLELQESPETINNPGALAIIKQSKYDKYMGDYPDYWAYGVQYIVSCLKESDGSDEAIQEILNTYSDTIRNLINV